MDVWSRRIVGWHIADRESADVAAAVVTQACADGNVNPRGLVLHSDNGAPMRSSTMISTLQWLGVVPSFSRPHVSDDNPYSEALFRTLKHTSAYPRPPFADAASARRGQAALGLAASESTAFLACFHRSSPGDRFAIRARTDEARLRRGCGRSARRHRNRASRSCRTGTDQSQLATSFLAETFKPPVRPSQGAGGFRLSMASNRTTALRIESKATAESTSSIACDPSSRFSSQQEAS